MRLFPVKIGEFIFHMHCKNTTFTEFLHTNFLNHISVQNEIPDIKLTIKDSYGIPFVNYNVSTTRESNHIVYKRADYLINVDNTFENAEISAYNELALKHALMNLFSAFIVHHNWGLLIHSSCVVDNEGAHLFSGHSGAGKSTVAMLSNPRDLLSDEATIVKITENKITIFDSPFRSDSTPLGEKIKSYPLKSIQFLNQAMLNQRILINQSDAFIQIIDKVFYWPNGSKDMKSIFSMLKQLVTLVPIYDLHFKKDNTFWEMIS
ncbi:hypothetical protein [Bacillus sp. NEB1478]|uniref:hypothetical protein n=1 Tax=Bacillus sp. NEB1478 TaxID=3073816 RepID=UPI002872FD3D|nr:hypothetical protein [Bacillus sp. NEB1478]WNB92475.1 hypothetical protein RGB74_02075 [Bacillus sp. NEB1478]